MSDDNESPSVGMNAETGRAITGWDHVLQSLRDIFTTPFGERIMREWYGSFVPALLGSQINKREITRYFIALTSAIEQWEPRFRVTRIRPTEVNRAGEFHLMLEGEYRPRANFGDSTAQGARRVIVSGAGGAVSIRNDR
ncbi:MAG: GPW/gp25 family protein [Loktanella sp.]|nr:GPW/gp25 family protein [Loktanella sp.]